MKGGVVLAAIDFWTFHGQCREKKAILADEMEMQPTIVISASHFAEFFGKLLVICLDHLLVSPMLAAV